MMHLFLAQFYCQCGLNLKSGTKINITAASTDMLTNAQDMAIQEHCISHTYEIEHIQSYSGIIQYLSCERKRGVSVEKHGGDLRSHPPGILLFTFPLFLSNPEMQK